MIESTEGPGWALSEEGAYRWRAWIELGAPNSTDSVTPADVRRVGLYRGGQGIFVDKQRTASAEFPAGVAVSVLHTESVYADELREDGILYHYPRTDRTGNRDTGEIQATKNTRSVCVPVAIVIRPTASANYRHIRWGWVVDFDDSEELFYIQFEDPQIDFVEVPSEPFNPTAARKSRSYLSPSRPGQTKFRFDVFKRYGCQCAVCSMAIKELLEAAHIVDKQFDGCDDPRNGLVLCRNHHRAFDREVLAINPDTLAVEPRQDIDLPQLGVTRTSIGHLRRTPAIEALQLAFSSKKPQASSRKVSKQP